MGLIREAINLKCKVIKKETVYKSPTNVYDITVPNNHNFILANGAIVHNCDTYQSAQIQQQLTADGFNVGIVSVDRLDSETKQCLPYSYFKSTIYEKRVSIYRKCDLLTEEILGLERESDGHINHPDLGNSGSKDISDAICGSIWEASQHADEFAFEFGEDLDNTIFANADDSYEANRLLIQLDFEEELNKMFDPLHELNKEDLFMDFGLGQALQIGNMSSYYAFNGIII